jgi:hypothetical protein
MVCSSGSSIKANNSTGYEPGKLLVKNRCCYLDQQVYIVA